MKKLSDQPFALLGVNSDKDLANLRATNALEQINWRSWWDDGRVDGPIQTTWQVRQRPTVHLLDAKGVIRYKDVQPEQLDAAIEKLLAEMKTKKGKGD